MQVKVKVKVKVRKPEKFKVLRTTTIYNLQSVLMRFTY